MNVFCLVVDATKAVPHMVEGLKANRFVEEAVLAVGSEPKLLGPMSKENFQFSQPHDSGGV